MQRRETSVVRATLTLMGGMIGAGIFGLPALFAYVGFWPGTILFWALAGVMLVTHVYFADIILAFRKRMRLAGYAREVLGKHWFVIAGFTYPAQLIGVSLIYIILGGSFLAAIFALLGIHLPLIFWQLLFWLVGAIIVFFGLRFFVKVDSIATRLLIITILVITLLSVRSWNVATLSYADWSHAFVPFGVFLFSLFGIQAIGETVEVAGRTRARAMRAVIGGTLIAAFLSWMFGVSIFLALHGHVGRNPTDLVTSLPHVWSWLILVMGLLSVSVAFITVAEDLKNTFHLDFSLHERPAWALAVFLPLILFVIQRDFLATVDFVGMIFGAFNSFLVIFIAYKLFFHKVRKPLFWSAFGSVILLLIFVLGILHKFLYQPLV